MEGPGESGSVRGELALWAARTPLHEAARRGEARQLRRLIESGACVNALTFDSITPLHEASLRGQAQCVQLLLDAGAQVDARNIDGSTPLCDACASGSVECARLLLARGASVNPPLFTASPLHEACMNGANVNAAKLHETALHHAAKVRNVDLVELLVEFGGNIYARDNRGKKPSDYTWSSSPTAKCFEFYEKTPLSLLQLCRVSVRRAAGRRGLRQLPKLQLPPRLIQYLSYD
ncbi:ankyrin repeat and SOCS box protein 13 isoform X2 [Passer domesticus]|uniref:ankyrin repeat and SOCS box protein 13 isoform X2 n=1 Tax=Passer domesticus TaxID=48849 RepID=UPI0030FE8B9C